MPIPIFPGYNISIQRNLKEKNKEKIKNMKQCCDRLADTEQRLSSCLITMRVIRGWLIGPDDLSMIYKQAWRDDTYIAGARALIELLDGQLFKDGNLDPLAVIETPNKHV